MTEYGYEKQRFPNLAGEMFDCPICTNVVKKPKECIQCGDLFCCKCIDDWMNKNKSCPKRCGASVQFMTSQALIRIYKELDIKCESCNKLFKLGDIDNHQKLCNLPKCWNFDICTAYEAKDFKGACSQKCSVLFNILKTKGTVKEVYEILKSVRPVSSVSKIQGGSGSKVASNPNIPSDSTMRWNMEKKGQNLAYENDGKLVMLKESAYVFRTAISSSGFTSGHHYWEIIPDARTENQLKIGVTTSVGFDFNTAFCDHPFGYAYYGLGQLRSGSNSSGNQYGKRLKKQGTLGIFLNMDKGQLSFSLNGENMGVAFESEALKKGPIYPAVALLHCAGCSIKGELPVPACFK